MKTKIGVVKEIKNNEFRIGLVPNSIKELIKDQHEVFVETNAGIGTGISDAELIKAGAKILPSAKDVFDISKLIIKVKEPLPEECAHLRSDHVLFTFLHLASMPTLVELLKNSGCTALGYETLTDGNRLPILTPMSEIAGKLAVQLGAQFLEKPYGGKGILLSGATGELPATIVVLGGGNVGLNSIRIGLGMGADVIVIDKSLARLEHLQNMFGLRLKVQVASESVIASNLVKADLVIGSILVPGASAPKIVTEEMLRLMQPRSVIIDVAIDQGGCFETSHPSTFDNPTFIKENIVHSCITNLPGIVPRTSAFALNHVTLPYIKQIAMQGYKAASLQNSGIKNSINILKGKVVNNAVAKSTNSEYHPIDSKFLEASKK